MKHRKCLCFLWPQSSCYFMGCQVSEPFSSSECNSQFIFRLHILGNRNSQHRNTVSTVLIMILWWALVAIAGCMRCMEQHSTVSFLVGTWGQRRQIRQWRLAEDFFSINDDKLLVFQVPNFVKIGETVAEISRFCDFPKWRPPPS